MEIEVPSMLARANLNAVLAHQDGVLGYHDANTILLPSEFLKSCDQNQNTLFLLNGIHLLQKS